MSRDLPIPATFYVIPRGGSVQDPLAMQSETLGLKFEVDGQFYGAQISQETLERAGIKIVASPFSDKGRLDILISPLFEGALAPARQ